MNETMDNDDIRQPSPELEVLLENQLRTISALQQIQLNTPNLSITAHMKLAQAIANSSESYDILAQTVLLEFINE